MVSESRPPRDPKARPGSKHPGPAGEPADLATAKSQDGRGPVPGPLGSPPPKKRELRPIVPRNTLPPPPAASESTQPLPRQRARAAEQARAAKLPDSKPPTAIRGAIFGERLLEAREEAAKTKAAEEKAKPRGAHDDLLAAFLDDEPLPLSEPFAAGRPGTGGKKHR